MRGVPRHLRSDNGPEFVALPLRTWRNRVGVETLDIEPGSPREARSGRRPEGRNQARAAVDSGSREFPQPHPG